MITVAALYKFAAFDDPSSLQAPLLRACEAAGIKGTLLLATEGINGTIAGAVEGIDVVLAHIRTLPSCADLDVKFSTARTPPFLRMKVRLKKEIVTLGVEGVDPARQTGRYVDPEDWNAVINDPGTILIDTRNDYEVKTGSFRGAINPETKSFREFPDWFREHRKAWGDNPKVAMFCTGGIRCEKSTAFLKAEGIEDVVHLKGGILKYLETVPPEQSQWDGECFVFDERVTVGHGLVPGTHSQCRACRMPLNPEEQASPLFEDGVQCPHCASEKVEAQRDRYAERQRQMLLAEQRGMVHLGDSAKQ
jgi:UPF0176 protein